MFLQLNPVRCRIELQFSRTGYCARLSCRRMASTGTAACPAPGKSVLLEPELEIAELECQDITICTHSDTEQVIRSFIESGDGNYVVLPYVLRGIDRICLILSSVIRELHAGEEWTPLILRIVITEIERDGAKFSSLLFRFEAEFWKGPVVPRWIMFLPKVRVHLNGFSLITDPNGLCTARIVMPASNIRELVLFRFQLREIEQRDRRRREFVLCVA